MWKAVVDKAFRARTTSPFSQMAGSKEKPASKKSMSPAVMDKHPEKQQANDQHDKSKAITPPPSYPHPSRQKSTESDHRPTATFFFEDDDASTTASMVNMNNTPSKRSIESGDADDVFLPGDESMKKAKFNMAPLSNALSITLSGMYGIFLVVMGAVMPMAETFADPDHPFVFEQAQNGTHWFEIALVMFYVYLYGVSIAFLLYVYFYLLRRYRLQAKFLQRTLSRSLSFTKSFAKAMTISKDEKGKYRKRRVSVDTSHHTGSFYLRLGAIGFGIGSMIHSGLHFGQYFQVFDGPSMCHDVVQAIKPLLHLLFTFIQLYFIFENSKMCVNRYKTLARFGMMHMCGTNICVWFRSIVVETLHAIHIGEYANTHSPSHSVAGHPAGDLHDTQGITNFSHSLNNVTHKIGRHLSGIVANNGLYYSNSTFHKSRLLPELTCTWDDFMGRVVESAGPYLYPCTIEYSLICAGVLYVMWSNVGKGRGMTLTTSAANNEDHYTGQHNQRMSVDCANSSRGLFLGILMSVGAIISMIAFYVMIDNPEMRDNAIILVHVSESGMYVITTVCLLVCAYKMRALKFRRHLKAGLEETLILMSFTGLFVFAVFSIIAAVFRIGTIDGMLTVVTNVSMMIQATIQTIFMLAGDRMCAATSEQARKKPGREFVTFLLLCNFAMWAMNTFETQKAEHNILQIKFYGPVAWAIFTHVSVPLGIFYRFHSSVCLSNIWKNAWKLKEH